jgi:hypothetical protein
MNKILVESVSSVLSIKPEAVTLETSQENTTSGMRFCLSTTVCMLCRPRFRI